MHSKIDGWPIPCLTNVINDHYHLNLTRSVNYFTLFTLVHSTDIKTINDANVIREITFMALALHNILLVFILQSTDTKHVELMWCKRPCYVQYVTGMLKQLVGMFLIMREDVQLYKVLISKQQLIPMECGIINLIRDFLNGDWT